MVVAAGNHVTALHRSAVGPVSLDPGPAPGGWRWLHAEEVAQLTRKD